MNQTIKHSQMPEFKQNESIAPIHLHKPATTRFLNQHPTAANTVQYKSSGLAPAALIAIAISAAIISGFTSCSADQHATAAQTEHLVKAGVKP